MLAAIAKDEAAYLPDWIFHHLYFGFDAISIYVNNTTDCTWKLADALNEYKNVQFIKADWYFSRFIKSPQVTVYKKAIKRAKKLGYSHVMFLDIDEFWTPADFETSITEFLNTAKGDAISFEWLMKDEENNVFAPPYQQINFGHRHTHVKTVFRTDLVINTLNPHNISAENCDYRLADGSKWPSDSDKHFQVPKAWTLGDITSFFVLHRYCRSQIEYISLLGRGRPHTKSSLFKDNRNGYSTDTELLEFKIDNESIKRYNLSRQMFLVKDSLKKIEEDAQYFVKQRYLNTVELIKNAPINEFKVLKRVLRNVTDEKTIDAFRAFCSRHSLEYCISNHQFMLEGDEFASLRKASFILAKKHPLLALSILMLLRRANPDGKIIKQKIKELKERLNIK